MYCASFIFQPGEYDEEFHRLNDLIDAAALATEGYIGAESWHSGDGKTINATYYWESQEALRTFSRHPKHLEAKRQYQRWYKTYHIVVAEVLRSYGDGGFPHFTPNDREKHSNITV